MVCPRLVIAGLKGGSGKTTLTLALIAAWRDQGCNIVPFKKGPDYIDAGWLSAAAGRQCYNLDPFLIGKKRILLSFRDHFINADCAVIEGNRGLYDGMDAFGTYSTAELAKLLKSPTVLILDCTKVTRTVAATVLGVKKFDRAVAIKGVVLNRIAGIRHEKIVRETIEKYTDVPVLGALPKISSDFLTERHMGLTPFQEHPEVKKTIARASQLARNHLDLDKIWDIACQARALRIPKPVSSESFIASGEGPVIGIIRDSAFQFYYPENFEELEKRGARLVQINALTEEELPPIDALYIGGGFPETHAIALAENSSFRKSIRDAVEKGLPVYAECGGLMFLGEELSVNDRSYPMAGIFPLRFTLEAKPQAHGYTIVEVNKMTPFYPSGTALKGHEFHYSRVTAVREKKGMTFTFRMERGQGIVNKMDGVCYKNALATYTHVHAYGSSEWAEGLVRRAQIYRKQKGRGSLGKERKHYQGIGEKKH